MKINKKFLNIVVKAGYSPPYVMDAIISKNTYRLMMMVEDLKRQRQQDVGAEYNLYSDAIKILNHIIKEIQIEVSRIALQLSNKNY